MRTEGAYIYLCKRCETTFAVVSRFGVKADRIESLICPKCSGVSNITGEGFIKHIDYNHSEVKLEVPAPKVSDDMQLPALLRAGDVAKYLNVSQRVAYEYMERKDFPLIRLGRAKRVNKHEFLEWLDSIKLGGSK